MGRTRLILLDTHVWLWYFDNPALLSEAARDAIDKNIPERGLTVSAISAWEIYQQEARAKLILDRPASEWIAQSRALPFFHFTPIDEPITRESVQLPGDFHSDPADRMIVATARLLGVPLVTKDEKILSYPEVHTIW